MTGGGTAGHVNPALSVADYIKTRHSNTEFLYVGNEKMIESILVPKAGYDFVGLDTIGFSRSISFGGLKRNVEAVHKQIVGRKKAKKIIEDFKPNVVLGTGGFVCIPIVTEAAKRKIPTFIQESNAFPGKATKYLGSRVNAVLIVNEAAKKNLKSSVNTVVTGNPVSEQVINYGRDRARKELGLGDNEICILSFGGSLGADTINKSMAALMGFTMAHYKNVKHIHATGKSYKDEFDKLLFGHKVNVSENKNLDIREYIDDMPRCINAADIVISRSGSTTLNEISCCGKASILIPSPNVTENHQYHNAMVLGENGGAIVIEEKNLGEEKLIFTVRNLLDNPHNITKIGKKAGEMAITDACARIYTEIKKVLPGY